MRRRSIIDSNPILFGFLHESFCFPGPGHKDPLGFRTARDSKSIAVAPVPVVGD